MLSDSPETKISGEFSAAQMLNKLVFTRSKHQTISYKRHKRQ